jgi:ubiquinone/menaquinone biosynthesis C-methylase UbiE
MKQQYVHGYSSRESRRLGDQASTLADLLHDTVLYPDGSRVLEAGCGVGSQTVILARRSPGAHFVCIDMSEDSLARAQDACLRAGLRNVEFQRADIMNLEFAESEFDHVFICFVLEHLADPVGALGKLRRVLKPGGSLTAIEGDHGSFYCHPETAESRHVVNCLVEVQARLGGDSLIGRRLYPLLASAGLRDVCVEPRMVYVDSSRPDLVEGFSKNTFTAMVEGAREKAFEFALTDEARWKKGIADLYRATETDGVFCYTFFRARGFRAIQS